MKYPVGILQGHGEEKLRCGKRGERPMINDRENVFMELDHSAHAHETRLIRIHTHVCISRKGVAMDE